MSNEEIERIDVAVDAAARTAAFWAESTPAIRSGLLRGLAAALDEEQARLIAIADDETGLGGGRLTGEVARTTSQLRGFADEVERGAPYGIVDEPAKAGVRPRLTRVKEPLGPVAMFSASNFPFAFAVLGGDTASALAAGCPVVVKAHPAHPKLTHALFDLAQRVLTELELPAGLMTLVEGASRAVGVYLVQHPLIAAVSFTGSVQGGIALWKVANERPQPIPFFGELGSTNPIVARPAFLATQGKQLAKDLAASMTAGCGQFCTNPGVLVLFDDPASRSFVEDLSAELAEITPHRMLTPDMRQSFDDGMEALEARAAVRPVIEARETGAGPSPRLFEVEVQAFLDDPELREEYFGPATLVLTVDSVAQAEEVLSAIGGSLAATLWGFEEDSDDSRRLLRAARRVAGRVLFGGVPTGVAVTAAQQHGGPWPSSTQPQTTSVGYTALERFLRPVALQNAPDWAVGA